LNVSELEERRSFALLGPGFGSAPWTLVTDLRPTAAARPTLVFAAFETRGRDCQGYCGEPQPCGDLRLDSPCQPLDPQLWADGHADQVGLIREAIAAGDVYQVCLTVRASFASASASSVLATMCARGVPRYAAWVRLPDGQEFVSGSPELFFAIEGDQIRSEPMKGTAPRGSEAELAASSKDWSELAMITDLVRNDLTPICLPRSVRVLNAQRMVRLPYASQTVSDIAGTLAPGVTLRQALDALHPGGSVVGAPKRAALRMIRQLEGSPRGPYCGVLGYLRGQTAMVSLLIRTATRSADGWIYGVGGGIVYESDPARELAEVQVKLGALR